MLLLQMTATHALTMKMASKLNRETRLPQFDSVGLALQWLQRTFTSQVETFAKLRRGGEQHVRVEHVTVQPGGQAIVGNITHIAEQGRSERGVGSGHGNDQQGHAIEPASLAYAPGSPMWGADAQREPVSSGSREGEEAVPDARRRSRQRRPTRGS